ncbi:hypothetical protein Tco_0848509 [Tanacetum coccineum]
MSRQPFNFKGTEGAVGLATGTLTEESLTPGKLNPRYTALVNVNRMDPKRTSTSTAPPMTQAAIKKLVADSVVAALEAQAATMANTDNTNRSTG